MQKYIRINDRIKSSEVRVIGPNAEQLGVVVLKRAMDLAQEHGLDLVEVAPTGKPPVCRIMDFSKYKYDQEKKERRIKKNQSVTHLKQVRLKPHIEEHDYNIKLKQILVFLKKKDKVKVNMFFRGREMMYKDQGSRVLKRIIADVVGHGQPEKSSVMEGRVMSMILIPHADKTQKSDKKEDKE